RAVTDADGDGVGGGRSGPLESSKPQSAVVELDVFAGRLVRDLEAHFVAVKSLGARDVLYPDVNVPDLERAGSLGVGIGRKRRDEQHRGKSSAVKKRAK